MSKTSQAHPAALERDDGILHALLLDGQGGARPLARHELQSWSPDDGVLWLHLDYSLTTTRQMLAQDTDLSDALIDVLLTEESRPRASVIDQGVLMALRGVNLHPDANPEDMVSLRLWATRSQVVTTRRRRLLSVEDTRSALLAGTGPAGSGDIITTLARRLTERMQTTIDELDDRVAEVDTLIIGHPDATLRSEISAIRRTTIMLRRYLAPQREALSSLVNSAPAWIDKAGQRQLREVLDRLVRYIEDLDSIRDRAAVSQEELLNRQSERLNSRLYLLSLVSAIFLPLGFLTGLLGINVGGVPGADNPYGFAITLALVSIVAVLMLVWFRRQHWL